MVPTLPLLLTVLRMQMEALTLALAIARVRAWLGYALGLQLIIIGLMPWR